MSSEVAIGIGGVVVGAVASGAVQAFLARGDRARSGRTAARLLYLQLHGAHWAIEDLRERRDWSKMITNWEAYAVAWERHGDALVQVLSANKAAHVTTAFECLVSLANSRASDIDATVPQPGVPGQFGPSDELLAMYVKAAEVAKLITLRASFHWWNFRSYRRALKGTARETELQRQRRSQPQGS